MINYSYWRIKHIFHDDYGLELKNEYIYKSGRYSFSPVKYSLNSEDGTPILKDITLDALRLFLEEKHYPLN